MAEKRSIEVIIAGEVYKIAGTESEDHMKRVARFLNERVNQTQRMASGKAVSKEYIITLSAINICDDFVKLVEHTHLLQERLEQEVKKQKALKRQLAGYEEDLIHLEQENQDLREQLRQSMEISNE